MDVFNGLRLCDDIISSSCFLVRFLRTILNARFSTGNFSASVVLYLPTLLVFLVDFFSFDCLVLFRQLVLFSIVSFFVGFFWAVIFLLAFSSSFLSLPSE